MTPFPGVNLHAAEQGVAVKEEGNPDNFWDEAMPERGAKVAAVPDNEDVQEDINDEVFRAGNQAEDIAMVRNLGFEVDDDSNLLPKMSLLLTLPRLLMEVV